MSKKLMNFTKNQLLLAELQTARSFWARGKGLLGVNSLKPEQGLWILWCCSIHTFFMRFSIDCIFVDQQMRVKALKKNVKPWKLVLPIWGATSVFEMSSGTIDRHNIELGDQLNVVS